MSQSQRFLCSLEEIPRLREFIRQSLNSLDEVILNQIVLAADEVCTNAIQHGCSRADHSDFFVRIHIQPQKITLEIQDSSQPFPIGDKVKVDCNEKIKNREKGGLGLFLVQKIMDEIAIEELGKHHIIRMCKYIG
jgi:serine/threonine-protein kinase RsbW